MGKSLLLLAFYSITIMELCWTGKVSASSCQVHPSEYAYLDSSVSTSDRASANCRRYSPMPLVASIHSEDYTHCDGTQLRLTDSDFGSEQFSSSDYYVWDAGTSRSQLLFIFATRVNLTTITLHYYSNNVRGLPRLRFYAVPDDFDVWAAPTGSYSYVDVAAVLPGGEPAGPRNVSISFKLNVKKLLMYKYRSDYTFAMSEIEFFTCTQNSMTNISTTETPPVTFTTMSVTTTETTSEHLTPPMVKLIASTANPVLTGSSLELMCIVEWMDNVTNTIDVQVEWTGPDGAIPLLTLDMVKKSASRYISKVVIHSVETTHTGKYTCTAHIANQLTFTAKSTLAVGDAVFQLRLKRTDDCHLWTYIKAKSLKTHIEEALIEAVESHCQCLFPRSQLLNGSFHCQSSSAQATYRNTLRGTYSFNATQIICFIQDWVNSGAVVNKDWYSVGIDKNCPVAVQSLKESECG